MNMKKCHQKGKKKIKKSSNGKKITTLMVLAIIEIAILGESYPSCSSVKEEIKGNSNKNKENKRAAEQRREPGKR